MYNKHHTNEMFTLLKLHFEAKCLETWNKSDYILFPLNISKSQFEDLFEKTCRRRQYDINLYFYALSNHNTTKGLSSPITQHY